METFQLIGKSVPRSGFEDKIAGNAKYTADLRRPGMLYARVLRSPHAHARITAIQVEAAAAMPGVHGVLTYLDAPKERITYDLAVLDSVVRYVGDEVALVAAESPNMAEDALEKIVVTYEVLPAAIDSEAALAPGAPEIHPGGNLVDGKPVVLERGNTAAGMASAAQVFEATFRTQYHAPGGMEPRVALAEWENGALTVWKTSRAVHDMDRASISRVLGLPEEQVRVLCTHMGGGFGNKDESRVALLTALLAKKTGRPVRLEYSREEECIAGHNRQPTVSRLKVGVDAAGAPVAIDMYSIMDGGAYISSGRAVIRRVGQGPLYLYTCPNARYEGRTAFTNRPAGGSFRGLGAPLGHFALEVLMDIVAESLGVDPLDYRLAHHVTIKGQPGKRITPPDEYVPDEPVEGGIPFSSNGLRECMEAGAERIGWRERRRPNNSGEGPLRRGIGMAMGHYKGGAGRPAEAEVELTAEGRIEVRMGGVDVGQGSTTVMAQFAAEVLQATMDQVDVIMADTANTPRAHITAGSSTTVSSGGAVKLAAEEARNRLLESAASLMGVDQAVLDGGVLKDAGGSGKTVTRQEVAAKFGARIKGQARINSASKELIINSFAVHFAEVEVEIATGRIHLLRYLAAQDSGRIVHPAMAENQVTGGVLQFLSLALREEYYLDPKSGVLLNPSFLEHKSTAMVDYPPIEVLFCGTPDPVGAFGSKGLGEPPVVPVYATIANAVANAVGVRLYETPFTPDRVLRAIHEQGRAGA